ncbi:MAG: IclR family transcriptional regulator [Verrucomicrobiae bacterium]|nr:IclR family transcriptional regulator [Verrucomicrobiae bacterium]
MKLAIQVLDRAFDILERVAAAPETPRSLGEIADQTKLHPATCARILKDLVARGYVEQIAHKKGYILGPLAYALSAKGAYRRDLSNICELPLSSLAKKAGQSVILTVLSQGRRIVICELDSGSNWQIQDQPAQTFDPYQTATGRLLLAFMEDDHLTDFIQNRGLPGSCWPEIQSESQLRKTLEKIRNDGSFILSKSSEIVGLAWPIQQRGQVIAAMGIPLPSSQLTRETRATVLSAMKETAQAIEKKLN